MATQNQNQDNKKKKDEDGLKVFAERIFATSCFRSIEQELYVLKDNVYTNSKSWIRHEIGKYNKAIRKAEMEEIISFFKRWAMDNDIADPTNSPSMSNDFIPFKNGILNIKTNQFIEWKHKDLFPDFMCQVFLYNLPTNYKSDYINKETEAKKILMELANYDIDVFNILCEVAGICIYKGTEHQKAVFLKNASACNGKSTFLNLLSGSIGRENICYHPIQNLDGFAIADLENKLVNICDDLPADYIGGATESKFKELTSGAPQSAAKKYAQYKTFVPFVTLIFACNQIPRFKHMDAGLARRLLVIPFDNKFDKQGTNRDKGLVNRVLKDKKLHEEFLCLAVQGLQRLISNNFEFSYSSRVEEMYKEALLEQDPVRRFYVDEVLCSDWDLERFTVADFYENYTNWVRKEGLRPVGSKNFRQETNKILDTSVKPEWDKILKKTTRKFISNEGKFFDRGYIQQKLNISNKELGINEEIVKEEKPSTKEKLPDEKNPLINKSIPF